MNGLEQLQPLISPPPIDFWPPAPGWWLLLLLLPLLGFAAWRLRRFIPVKKRPIVRAEQPLDPVRIAALAELAQMPKPYDGAPAGPGCSSSTACSNACAATTTLTARATPSMAANGWRSSTTAARRPV